MANPLKTFAKRFLKRRGSYYGDLVFRRLSTRALRRLLEQLGLGANDVVLVHSAFSELGYVPGGPNAVIAAIRAVIGPGGTLVMPTFPTAGSMETYLDAKPQFDVRTTPSRSGALTEAFRTAPGVLRSVHPTHPVAARGPRAREIVAGHEHSTTPCGPESPFGRLAGMNAVVLRIGIGALTPWHYIQEQLSYPNMLLPRTDEVPCIDADGRPVIVRTAVYRKVIPNAFFLGEDVGDQLLSVRGRDFPILFRGRNEAAYRADPRRQLVLQQMLDIRSGFESRGVLRSGVVNGCICDSFPMDAYLEYALSEGRRLLDGYRHRYELRDLARMLEAGEYPP